MGRQDFENRVLGGDVEDLCVAGVWPNAVKEGADLELPPLQVSTQDWHLLLIRQLAPLESLRTPAGPQLTGPGYPQVAHPLTFATRRHQVTVALVIEQVHRCRTPNTARSTPHCQNPRSEQAQSMSGQERDGPVEDVAGEPSRGAVVHIFSLRSLAKAPASGCPPTMTWPVPVTLRATPALPMPGAFTVAMPQCQGRHTVTSMHAHQPMESISLAVGTLCRRFDVSVTQTLYGNRIVTDCDRGDGDRRAS